jgi:hypothetical protein
MPRRKMTIEEATERILAGEYFLPCPQCAGLAFVRVAAHETDPNGIGKLRPCMKCLATGRIYESTYNQACRVLKMKRVDRPTVALKSFAKMVTLPPFKEAIRKYTEEDVAASWEAFSNPSLGKPFGASIDKKTP